MPKTKKQKTKKHTHKRTNISLFDYEINKMKPAIISDTPTNSNGILQEKIKPEVSLEASIKIKQQKKTNTLVITKVDEKKEPKTLDDKLQQLQAKTLNEKFKQDVAEDSWM